MMMICYIGFGANIITVIPWYGLHRCGASKNGNLLQAAKAKKQEIIMITTRKEVILALRAN